MKFVRVKFITSAFFVFFLFLFVASFSALASEEDTKKAEKKSWLVSAFPKIEEGDTSETFMRKVSDMLQGRILDAPHPISYLDKDGIVSEAAQKAFEDEVRKILAFEQKRTFSSYDLNADGSVTLKEVAAKDHIQPSLVEALYKINKAHGTLAIDEIHSVYDEMINTRLCGQKIPNECLI